MNGFDPGRSDALHARVQAFVRRAMAQEESRDSFDEIAVALAVHQAACGTGVDKLFAARGLDPDAITRAGDIPAVPTDAFRLRRVACHPPEADRVTFETSGTSAGMPGRHCLRRTATYRKAARAWGRRMLFADARRLHWILIAPPYAQTPSSSLGFMLEDFATAFGGSVTWGMTRRGLDVARITAAVASAAGQEAPTIVAGASFAFVHLIDALGGEPLPLGAGGRVMQTGGFKGRSREVDAGALRRDLASVFHVLADHVVGEYGMTELGSQAYDGTLRGRLGLGDPSGRAGLYFPPPWMRVRAVDPITLAELPEGREGIARIEDLANVDSAVAVQTADRVRVHDEGFEVLGRSAGASPRGCSIGVDEILEER